MVTLQFVEESFWLIGVKLLAQKHRKIFLLNFHSVELSENIMFQLLVIVSHIDERVLKTIREQSLSLIGHILESFGESEEIDFKFFFCLI